ncbi:hypothetical protein KKA14_06255, partial [bacterium]|nr:hypothetical protein [bacterium]
MSNIDMSEIKNSVENDFGEGSSSSKNSKGRTAKKAPASIPLEGLDSISDCIPYSRTFIKSRQSSRKKKDDKGGGLMHNLKGMIGGMKSREMDIKDVLEMRVSIGNLKKTQIAPSAPSIAGATLSSEVPSREQKTKRQLLEEKHKSLKAQSKLAKPDNTAIGLRIEIEKMKKKYPNDYNLIILSSIVTCRDGCLKHRTIEERVASLYSALQEAGEVVLNDYLTTFSIDTLLDIYFLYLTALKKQYVDNFKKISSAEQHISQVVVESTRRDIRIINALLDQKNLKKTIFNVTQKLNGFKYPFESMTPFTVAKSFNKDASNENEKTGPGTVKLNRFLIRIYLSVFAQIPFLQPLAKKLCDGLPDDQPSRVLIANVT